MELKDRLGDAIVAMLIGMMWTGLFFVGIWLAFSWLVESFGREVAIVTTFAIGGVVLAIVLWVASSRHTTSIWRSALNYAADTQELSVNALRSLATARQEEAKAHRIREQAHAQIEVASYKAALVDARQQARQEWRQEQTAPARSWAMSGGDDAAGGGDDFQWSQ